MKLETNYDPKEQFFHDANGDVHVIIYEASGEFQVDVCLVKEFATPEQMRSLAALVAKKLDGEIL